MRDATELDIDVDAWLKEIKLSEDRQAAGDPGLTSEELRQLWGCGDWKVRHILRRGAAQGAVLVGFSHRTNLIGRLIHVPVYRPADGGSARRMPRHKPRQGL